MLHQSSAQGKFDSLSRVNIRLAAGDLLYTYRLLATQNAVSDGFLAFLFLRSSSVHDLLHLITNS